MADQVKKQQQQKKPVTTQKPPVPKTGGSGCGAPASKPANPQSGQK